MADDKKISQLPVATTPLAGTEKIEILQGGVNKQVDASQVGGGNVPDADATTKGIAKLYTSTGSNTDGSMTQQAITNAVNTGNIFGLLYAYNNFT